MNSEPRKKFDQDFKRNAVLLCAEPGRSVVEVVKNLGVAKISYIVGGGNTTGQTANMYSLAMGLKH